MAENNTGPLAGIVGTLLSNPTLVQTALSLLSNGSGSSGGSLGGFDLSSVLNLFGGGGHTSPPAETDPPQKESEVPFDLEAFLEALPNQESTPQESKSADRKEAIAEKDASAVLLPSVSKKETHRRGGLHSDTALLLALRPYLNADRRAMIDNIVRVGRLMSSFQHPDTKDGAR